MHLRITTKAVCSTCMLLSVSVWARARVCACISLSIETVLSVYIGFGLRALSPYKNTLATVSLSNAKSSNVKTHIQHTCVYNFRWARENGLETLRIYWYTFTSTEIVGNSFLVCMTFNKIIIPYRYLDSILNSPT